MKKRREFYANAACVVDRRHSGCERRMRRTPQPPPTAPPPDRNTHSIQKKTRVHNPISTTDASRRMKRIAKKGIARLLVRRREWNLNSAYLQHSQKQLNHPPQPSHFHPATPQDSGSVCLCFGCFMLHNITAYFHFVRVACSFMFLRVSRAT